MHAIDVEQTVQVIDLVLQDARVPAFRFHSHWFGTLVQKLNRHSMRARNDRGVAVDTEAAFEELDAAVLRATILGLIST